MTDRLQADGITTGYDGRIVSQALTVTVPDGKVTAILGPNACGKSTLLRALSRLLRPSAGRVLLDGRDIADFGTKAVALELALLPQTSVAPDGIRVADLVGRGRFPHQSFLRQWSPADERAVAQALTATGIAHLADREVGELSGGQRQRVWVAMTLAQDTDLILLDEPTTYLDLAHQIDLMELFRALNREQGRTVVAVLHDLNQACRYADHLIVMKDGAIVAEGEPATVLTAELVEATYGVACRIITDPESHTPLVIPALGRPRLPGADATVPEVVG